MSSGFVPAGTILPDAPEAPSESDAAWAAARAAVSSTSTSNPLSTVAVPEDNRSLFDILAANKARKQEEFEEKLKFKNQFRALDEDDVEYLDSVLDGQKRVEHERKKMVEGEVERFREAQQGVDVAVDGAEAEGEEVWKKRRRGEKKKRSELEVVKRRKTELEKSGTEDKALGKAKEAILGKAEEGVLGKADQGKLGKPEGGKKPQNPVKSEVEKHEKSVVKPEVKPVPQTRPVPPTKPNPVALGLDYGSDDSD